MPRQTEAIIKFVTLKTLKDLRSIVGIANSIRNRISDISYALKHTYNTIKEYAVTRTRGKITMSNELYQEFNNFKIVLSTLPTIGLFQDGYPIIIFTYAFRHAKGTVVIQLTEKLN